MIGEIIRNILRFVFLLLVQVLVINTIDLGAFFIPQLYILFLLALPFETPKWMIIPLGFLFGIAIDIPMNTPGLHAAACVLVAWARPRILRLLAPRDGYEFGMQPSIQSMGLNWFMYYAGIMVVLHNTYFFLLEIFRLNEFFFTMLRIMGSSVATLALLVLVQYLAFRPKQR
jgi:rod shape-determining protein MreD